MSTEYQVNLDKNNNLVSDLYNAATTLDHDPGDHKKKALLGAAATGGGLYLALRNGSNNFKRPSSLIGTLISTAVPAGIYYAVQNRDRLGRAAAGLGLAATALKNRVDNSELQQYRAEQTDPGIHTELTNKGVGLSAAIIPAVYTAHQLQAAADEEKLEKLKFTPMDPAEKAMEINRVKQKADLFTRYPITRAIPGSSMFRKLYNELHPVEPVLTKKDVVEYNVLPQNAIPKSTAFL